MPSEVEIYNQALLLLGASPLTSPDDEGDHATLCRNFYPTTRDAVLRGYPWKCALYRQQLGRDASPPTFGYDYRYPLPVDPYCLRVVSAEPSTAEWIVEGRYLYSNSASISILYVRRIEDPGLFDALCMEAIATRLAAQLAYPITGSATKAMELLQLYAAKVSEARGIDRVEQNDLNHKETILTNIRR